MNEGHEHDKADRIISAALSVFTRHGFHRATMQDVAEEAGVGKGTTYLYFASKDQLLESIFDRAINWYFSQLGETQGQGLTARERIRDLIARVLTGAYAQRGVAAVLVEGSTGMSEGFKRKLGAFRARAHSEVRRVVTAGIAAQEIRAADPDMLAHVIVGTVTSLVTATLWSWETLPGDALPIEDRVDLLAELAMTALAL